jgi:hypothetical protein
MTLPVFGGMLIEPFSSFIVPTLYCAYMEFKLRAGWRDELLEMSVGEPSAENETPETVAARMCSIRQSDLCSVPHSKGVEK